MGIHQSFPCVHSSTHWAGSHAIVTNSWNLRMNIFVSNQGFRQALENILTRKHTDSLGFGRIIFGLTTHSIMDKLLPTWSNHLRCSVVGSCIFNIHTEIYPNGSWLDFFSIWELLGFGRPLGTRRLYTKITKSETTYPRWSG